MKKACLFVMVFFFMCMNAYTQKIHYSRQTVKKLYTDDIQLVADIGGNHHLIRLNVNKAPAIYIYNSQLQLQGEAVVDYKIREKVEAHVLPFGDYYYLYLHPAGTSQHIVYKIDRDGNSETWSAAFQQVVDSLLNKSSSLQLVNQNNRLYVIAHVYYDAIKKVSTTVVELDPIMKPVGTQKGVFNFNAAEDGLRQTVLAGSNLLVLKTNATEEKGYSLDLVKVELTTGKAFVKSFASGGSRYLNAGIQINSNDSTILLHATLGVGSSGSRLRNNGFISILNYSLEEITPFALLHSQFRNNADANYFLLEEYACWLSLNAGALRTTLRVEGPVQQADQNNYYPLHYFTTNELLQNIPTLPADAEILPGPRQPTVNQQRSTSRTDRGKSPVIDYNVQSRINFTVLNNRLLAVNDSVVSVKRYEFGIQPWPAAQVLVNNKASLFLIQNFSESSRRLLMLSAGKAGKLQAMDINVYDKYDYVLEQLRVLDKHSVIIPYIHKNQAGLVKISFD